MLGLDSTSEVAEELNPPFDEETEAVENEKEEEVEPSNEEEAAEEIDVDKIEAEDPSHTEGLTEEEKKAYSKGVQKRISSQTKKMHDARRETKKVKEDSEKEIAKIKSDYEQRTKDHEAKHKPTVPTDEGPDLKTRVKTLREKRNKAFSEMDMAAGAAIQDEIDELIDADRDAKAKAQPDVSKALKDQEVAVAQKVFHKKNPWFSVNPTEGKTNAKYDQEKSNYALSVERTLDDEGFSGNVHDLFDEIEKRTNAFFKIHKPSLPTVAGVNVMKKVKKVGGTLDANQRQVIEGFGLTEAQYVEQIKKQGAK